MVGDVKQSIYKFRLARPELFMEKFNCYTKEESDYQRIDLDNNFRSREIVLQSINFIFEQIMTERLGNISYNKEVFLNAGASFLKQENELISENAEVLIITEPIGATTEYTIQTTSLDTKNKRQLAKEKANFLEEQEYTNKELEAKAVAERIKQLVNPKTGISILDKDKTGIDYYRKAEYKDIVILLRTMTNWSEIFVDTLMAEGIPAYSATDTGYFSTIEIKLLLNMLAIIDNPMQDIPLTSVMRSYLGGFTSNELAMIRANDKKGIMYEAVLSYLEQKEKECELWKKLNRFCEQLTYFRNLLPYTCIHELIQIILEKTEYYSYIIGLPAGEKRVSNVSMLIQKAIVFEKSSYYGLFHFNRYIERLHKYEIDYGEANIKGENDNAVRIMSIHKSKGLEFPIVFVSGMGKIFNQQDTRSKLAIHSELGIGADYVNYKFRTKSSTLMKKAIQQKILLENLGEELRILYVALTRAKEKLILTGYLEKLGDKLKRYNVLFDHKQTQLPFYCLIGATSYLDWIICALIRNQCFESVLQQYDCSGNFDHTIYPKPIPILINTIFVTDLVQKEVEQQIKQQVKKEDFLCFDIETSYDKKIEKRIKEQLEYHYAYEEELRIAAKLTVTALKRMGYQTQQETEAENIEIEGNTLEEPPIPRFICSQEEISIATQSGTLYHKLLEKINLLVIHPTDLKQAKKDIVFELERLVEQRIITKDAKKEICIDKLAYFAIAPIATRIRTAQINKRIKQEQAFVIGVKANEISSDYKSEELVLVQGMIDLYFEEEDGIILLDYKTDYVPNAKIEYLVKRYQVQMDYYAKAIEKITGKNVKEKLIYSFSLGKTILLK